MANKVGWLKMLDTADDWSDEPGGAIEVMREKIEVAGKVGWL
jgi:hypothetical protein